jgi:exodeoxyribonuclease V beta subunit
LDEAAASLEAAARAVCGAWDAKSVRQFLTGLEFAKKQEPSEAEMEARLSALEGFCRGTRPAAIGAILAMCSPALEKRATQAGKKAVTTFAFAKACDGVAHAVGQLELALRAAFIRDVGHTFEIEKRRAGAAGYDDLLHRVHAALGDRARRALLKRTVARQFRAVLVDEFQDTDTIQYDIFRELVDGVRLLLIGDPKQAIYGFRGADVFAYLGAKRRADRRYTMDCNQRSETGLVKGLNGVFSSAERPFVFDGIDYVEVGASGRADSEPIAGDDRKPIEWTWLPPTKNKTEGQASACAAVVSEVTRLLSGITRIGGRTVEARDIAVLTRTNEQARKIQEALHEAHVPAVISRADNVLESEEAAELHALLRAVAEPRSDSAIRAALATRVWGYDAAGLLALQDDEQAWQSLAADLETLRETWTRKGFAVMAQALLHLCDARRRLLAAGGGARRLTNLLHLVELAHRASLEHHLSPDAVLTWLGHARRNADLYMSEATELRLETDAEAVQIATIHLSKGLEYEIVFCPFLWDVRRPGKDEPFLVHLADDRVVYDFSKGANTELVEAHDAERLSEDVRLAYVALTRAKRRDYVALGELGKDSAGGSPLAYLLNQPKRGDPAPADEMAAGKWVKATLARANPAEWRARIEKLCDAYANAMALRAWQPSPDAAPHPKQSVAAPALAERTYADDARSRLRQWRVASFSSFRVAAVGDGRAHHALAGHAAHRAGDAAPIADAAESAARELPDHLDPPLASPEEERAAGGMFAFARGPRAGTCLHEVFEGCDFTRVDDEATDGLVTDTLRRHSLDRAEMHDTNLEPARAVRQMLRDVVTSELPGAGFRLDAVARAARLNEWQFYVPMARVSQGRLADCLQQHGSAPVLAGYPGLLRALGEREVEGFLMGFVDLVFTHGERWYVVDWKSNHLGIRVQDYGDASIARAMREHHYVLQYHLYVVALHRYLASRLPRYDYDRHFGGVYYAFIRAIRAGERSGWYVDRPPRALVEALDGLIGATP